MNVLWVEDQFDENFHLFRVLERRGETVELAGTVAEALRKLMDGTVFDLVIVDLRIPLGEGDPVSGMPDGNDNGRHVLKHLVSSGFISRGRAVCLTNFVLAASTMGLDAAIQIVPKASYLKDFEEAIYGRR